MKDFVVKEIQMTNEIKKILIQKHYTHSCPVSTRHCFCLYREGEIVGIALFGPFSRLQAARKYESCIELTRFFTIDELPKNTESFFLGKCLRMMQKGGGYSGVVSYADPTEGHQGTIYKAANFKHISMTGTSYHYLDPNGERLHKRSVWERARKNGITEKKQSKKEKLERVNELPKLVYFYPLKKNFEIKPNQRVSEHLNHKSLSELFLSWSRESAWLYGVILGDGHVDSREDHDGLITICGNKNTIDKISKIISHKTKIIFRSGVYHIRLHNKEIAHWFKNRGVLNCKSHNLPWPTDIPEELMWDFVRGLIDTDGSFRINDPKSKGEKGRKSLLLGYASATKFFVEKLKEFLACETAVCENHKHWKGKDFIHYSIKMSFQKSIEVLDKVYDCPVHIRNEERFNKYVIGKELLSKYNQKCKCGRPLRSETLCFKCINEKKDKPKIFCFCGKEAFSQKLELCSLHYHKFRRSEMELEAFKDLIKSMPNRKRFDYPLINK